MGDKFDLAIQMVVLSAPCRVCDILALSRNVKVCVPIGKAAWTPSCTPSTGQAMGARNWTEIKRSIWHLSSRWSSRWEWWSGQRCCSPWT